MVDSSSLVTSIVTSLIIFVVCLAVYTFLARKASLNVIYYPARLLAGLSPPSYQAKQHPLTWFFAALETNESELVSFAGLDAAIYVRMFKSGVLITGLSMVFCLPVIVPICATDDQFSRAMEGKPKNEILSYSDFETLSMGNIQESSKARLWVCMLGVYWVSGVVYYVLYRSFVWVASVRARFQGHALDRTEQYVILVRDIPASKKEDDIERFFQQLHPDAYEKCLLVRDLTKVNKVYLELEKVKAKLWHAEGTFLRSRTGKKTSPVGKRPEHKTGFLGLVGPKVDSINYLTDSIRNELLPKLEEEQRATEENKSSMSAAFIIFKTRRAATLAAQAMHAQDANTWVVSEAPEAREVVFENLARASYQRFTLKIASFWIMTAIVLFYSIPIAFVSSFTTLTNLEKLAPFVKDIPQSVKSILEAFLPKIAIMVFTIVLPSICIFLSKLEGLPSQSEISRAASGKYYTFNLLNVFLILSLGGSLWGSIKQITTNFSSSMLLQLLGQSLAQSSTTWVVFLALGMFAGWGTDLLAVGPLVMYYLKTRFLCKTDKEERAAWEPKQIEYHTKVPVVLLMFTIALVYAVIAPMILPFAFVYFLLGYAIAIHQAMNVNVAQDFESQGRMWPHIYTRMIGALFLSQCTCAAYFLLRKTFAATFLLVPPVVTFVFNTYCLSRFYKSFEHLALTIAAEEPKQVPTVSHIADSFTPPCMIPDETLEDATFDDARSDALSAGLSSDNEEEGKSKRSRGSFSQLGTRQLDSLCTYTPLHSL